MLKTFKPAVPLENLRLVVLLLLGLTNHHLAVMRSSTVGIPIIAGDML